MSRAFHFNDELYENLLKSVASLTLLFGDGPHAYIDSRFVEKLFVKSTNGRDISRSDKAFDAIVGEQSDIGVGVKTFTINVGSRHKMEKVQEMTRYAGSGAFEGVPKAEVAYLAAEYRNRTITADAKEFNLDVGKSIYHCLIRSAGKAFVHEEPYSLISLESIRPVDPQGSELREFPAEGSGIRFSDGHNIYSFSKSKSVLMKRFDLNAHNNYPPISIEFNHDVWTEMESLREKVIGLQLSPSEIGELQHPNEAIPGRDFVVLPLYGSRKGYPFVEVASGINQWNAAGRQRTYGESYIPIPRRIHELAPGFFPDRETQFSLILPNAKGPVQAKVCQDGGKALMSNPNHLLCRWLYKVIDPHYSESDFDRTPNRSPFTYEDLERVGRDSVRVEKKLVDGEGYFEISFSALGSYEEFLVSLEDES